MTKHVPHFEVLRGLAALWVLVSHVLLIVDIEVTFLSRGDQAVDVFIILSGFVIALMLLNERESYGRYLFRRFARLYPLFLVALFYGSMTDNLYRPVFGSSPWLSDQNIAFQTREINLAGAWWEHLILHLSMLHGAVPDNILPQASLMFSGPLWSISLEWQFYLVAPILIALISFTSIRRGAVAILVMLAAIALEHLASRYWVGEVPSFLPLRLPLFIVGIMSAALWHRACNTSPLILLGALTFATIAAMQFSPNKLPVLIWFGVYFAAATHSKTAVTRLADRLVSSTFPRFVGRVSYGLYVLHVPTMMLVTFYIVIPLMGEAERLVAGLTIGGMSLLVTLALAHLSFQFLERPIIGLARQTSGRRIPDGGTDAKVA